MYSDMLLLAVTLSVNLVNCDIYLHMPRGSNNRLNEQSAERKNADRLFDSQNNNRGGYNVGDSTEKASNNQEALQYRMKYFQSSPMYKVLEDGLGSSHLTIEWTNQHGCGGNEDTDPHKQNCHLVLQYMCETSGTTNSLRNGVSTNTQSYNPPGNPQTESESQRNRRRSGNLDLKDGQHEAWDWYDSCYVRERNNGLFTADQKLEEKLGYSSAIHTRQNPNGNRRGYECPEERDYYPYFHSSPWKDIAILAENITMCPYFQTHSFNVESKYECMEVFPSNNRKPSRWNNEEECQENGGQWTELFNYLEIDKNKKTKSTCESSTENSFKYKWATPYSTLTGAKECLVLLNAPECMEAPWSRSNHLGNSREGQASNYTWILPHFPSGEDKQCVFRIRYNISTDDYDPYYTDASFNKNKMTGMKSPVEQNPYVEIGHNYPLRLAINTAQFGRTFQDRSHVFILRQRESGMDDNDRIYNLNVRGKRGNIVQVYPAVEYDFVPNNLNLREEDMVHIQWTGSNTHNNKPPGGDGQTGDAGEGTGGTDRNNIVETLNEGENYPVTLEKSTMWSNAKIVWIHHGRTGASPMDLALSMSSSGYYDCVERSDCNIKAAVAKGLLDNLLNKAPASYEGAVLKFNKGKYTYMCSRNNNFSNRSQKGVIIVQ